MEAVVSNDGRGPVRVRTTVAATAAVAAALAVDAVLLVAQVRSSLESEQRSAAKA